MPNRLAAEQSPYLLQHRDNPVDWWPWSDAAFEEAARLDKPVFLSIGYSTCHWCHVMAHESFEDEAVARLMNEAFVNIKVDREERPDIDQLYMTVCQMTTGHGGWPLTVLLTPDKKPFFAGTYLPKHSRHGRLGMLDFVPRVQTAWQQRRDELLASADELVDVLQRSTNQMIPGGALDRDHLTLAYTHLERRFDPQHGGFGSAPKFPSPHNLIFLLRYAHRTGEAKALEMVETTLRHLRLGGIWDHVGHGFHRYATDQEWLLPHFEKMLYDQALLAMAYTEAFEATRSAAYERTAREILTYVLRDMTDPAGGFYSAEDADSEGREGKFYVWEAEEVNAVLGEARGAAFMRVYGFEPGGNFEEEATHQKTGENIPHLKQPITDKALAEEMAQARQQLFAHREKRVHPGKDDKVLTDWNGLMIAALARAARVFGDQKYRQAAERAVQFVLEALRTDDGRLLHRWRQGEAAFAAMLDDYAFFIAGLLECYETTFDPAFLSEALALQTHLDAHYWDDANGAYFLAPDDGEELLVRQKEAYDGALPSGNSVAMMNLLKLSRLTGNTDFEDRAAAIGRFFGAVIAKQPAGFTAMLTAYGFALGPSYEVVIAGAPDAPDTTEMIAALRQIYLPNKVVVQRPPGEVPPITDLVAYAKPQQPLDGKATAYICHNFLCEQPTTDIEGMRRLLGDL